MEARYRPQVCTFCGVIPEIDIWRAADLMLKRYSETALEESIPRAPTSSRRRAIKTGRQSGSACLNVIAQRPQFKCSSAADCSGRVHYAVMSSCVGVVQ